MGDSWLKLKKKTMGHMEQLKALARDEDPMESIEQRLQEVRVMSKPRRQAGYCLDYLNSNQRDLILKYKEMPLETLRKVCRKGWKASNRFRWAIRLVLLLVKAVVVRKRYHADIMERVTSHQRMRRQVTNHSKQIHMRSSLSLEMMLPLSTHPVYRSTRDIKKVIWLLKAIKPFQHLFPAEMEKELARNLGYERYDKGRVIACQGKAPDRFYYILSGRVAMLREYNLSTGPVTKGMGVISKGMTTDPEEMEQQWLRENSLVAKSLVEVLFLEKQAYAFLQHTTVGPPVDFLRSLDLLVEFPVEMFVSHPDTIEYTYYGQSKIVVADSNRTPWLHIVKSGKVKVVRYQMVLDAGAMNGSKFTSPRVENLGCGKYFSHAGAMLGAQAKQRKEKRLKTDNNLPQIYRQSSSLGRSSTNGLSECVEQNGKVIDLDDSISTHASQENHGILSQSNSTLSQRRSSNVLGVSLPEIPTSPREDDFKPHNLWLTREQTEFEPSFAPKRKREPKQRSAYLQLDVLTTGDVFGLDHMQPAVASEPQGVSLLSDGAEVIKISKRFFLQQAGNNTMLKVETLYREYVSEDEAKEVIYDKETWTQYKTELWSRMAGRNLPHIASNR